MRSTHGVLVEHQRVLVTVESPRRAYQAVQRMTRSKTQRELWQVNAEHRDMSFNARGLYRLWPGGQSAGFLMRFSFLRAMALRMRCQSCSARILPPRQAPRALSARGPGRPTKEARNVETSSERALSQRRSRQKHVPCKWVMASYCGESRPIAAVCPWSVFHWHDPKSRAATDAGYHCVRAPRKTFTRLARSFWFLHSLRPCARHLLFRWSTARRRRRRKCSRLSRTVGSRSSK